MVLWLALPFMLSILDSVIGDHWLIQDTSREFIYMGVVAAVAFLIIAVPFLWSQWGHVPWRGLAGFALYSLFSGWMGGDIALNVLNHSSTAIGQPAEFKVVKGLKQAVSIRIVGEDYDGITFTCGITNWRAHHGDDPGPTLGYVYRGRLGLLWGEFRDK